MKQRAIILLSAIGLGLFLTLQPDKSVARGIRNNNPGNIIKSNVDYKGKKKISTDPRFEQFQTMEYGIRATMKTILYKYNTKGLKTIQKIINEWAPAGVDGNNPVRYAQRVEDYTGINKDSVFVMNKENLIKLYKAIEIVENGKLHNSDATINRAYSMI